MAWTDRRAAVGLALVTAAAAGVVVAAEPRPYDGAGALAVLATLLVALRLDAFGGIVAGLAGAAAVVAAKQLTGGWTARAFALSLATTLVLVVLGWVTGFAGGRLRERPGPGGPAGVLTPAHGSLGLLEGDVALARLDEEMVRARRHRRPLALVLLCTRVVDEDLGPEARTAALRGVARLVETLLRETDVPFAVSRGEVGAVLPETDAETAWRLVGPLVDAVTRASFTDRRDDRRRRLVDCVEVHVGIAVLAGEHLTADDMLAAARRSADGASAPAGLPERPGPAGRR